MMTNTIALIANSVGIIINTRRTVYPSIERSCVLKAGAIAAAEKTARHGRRPSVTCSGMSSQKVSGS